MCWRFSIMLWCSGSIFFFSVCLPFPMCTHFTKSASLLSQSFKHLLIYEINPAVMPLSFVRVHQNHATSLYFLTPKPKGCNFLLLRHSICRSLLCYVHTAIHDYCNQKTPSGHSGGNVASVVAFQPAPALLLPPLKWQSEQNLLELTPKRCSLFQN